MSPAGGAGTLLTDSIGSRPFMLPGGRGVLGAAGLDLSAKRAVRLDAEDLRLLEDHRPLKRRAVQRLARVTMTELRVDGVGTHLLADHFVQEHTADDEMWPGVKARSVCNGPVVPRLGTHLASYRV